MVDAALALAAVVVLGIAAQTLGYRLRIPSILLLLLFGFVAGPITGWLDPDALFGDRIQDIVALGVAVLLFEGGLGLGFHSLSGQHKVVLRLVTIGVLVTWALGTFAASAFLDFSPRAAALLAAILVVSGPTVILPLLRFIQPSRSLDAVLRWEGIVVDPIGALWAVMVFDVVYGGHGTGGVLDAVLGLLFAIAVGGIVGFVAARILVFLEARYWVPDHLTAATGLGLVLAAFTLAEEIRPESGLFAATLMGIALANQKRVPIHHIVDFKESLGTILLGSLFVLLAARVRLDSLTALDMGTFLFLAALVLVIRPLAVLASTAKTGFPWKDRAMLAWMAPRGIVAAAVASLFALRLEEKGIAEAGRFVPITFAVVVATVAIYGLTARPLARRLGVARPDPQGVLFVGANAVTRRLAKVLKDEGFRAMLVDTNREALQAARLDDLEATDADILSLHLTEDLDLGGIGRLWAITSDDRVNSLAATHFTSHFPRAHCCQVADPSETETDRHEHLRGRILFSSEATYARLRERLHGDRWVLRRTPITEQFDLEAHARTHGDDAMPLFLVRGDRLRVFTSDYRPEVRTGDVLVALVRAEGAGSREEE